MGRKILLEREIRDIDDVVISPDSPALNFGYGFFETVLYENGRLFFFQEHIDRLISSCTALNTPILKPNSLTEDLLFDLIEQNGMKDKCARIKIMYAPLFKKDEWVTVIFCNSYERIEKPVKTIVSNDRRDNPFYRHKTLSYMQNIIVQDKLKEFDEVLFTNIKGNITEGTRSNIIGIRKNILYFTDTKENYLQGIMQKNILKDHLELGFCDAIPVMNGFGIESLELFEELIMTNSLAVARNIYSIRHGKNNIKISGLEYSHKIRDYYLN